jgi:hypothetical protein
MTTVNYALAAAAVTLLQAGLAAAAEERASVPHDRDDRHFQKCFCWNNATKDYCNGKDWDESDECQQWRWYALWWTIPLVFLAITYILYPIFLFMGRMFCNCCGGRTPSDGCCCPSDNNRKYFGGYSKWSVVFTKTMYCLSFAGVIALAVSGIVAVARWHWSTQQFLTIIVETATTMLSDLQLTERSLANLTATPAFANSSAVAAVGAAYVEFEKGHGRMVSVREGFESDGNNKPTSYAYNALAYPMLVLLVGFFLMCCSVTGMPITILAGLFSWTTAMLVAGATVFLVIATGARTVCRNWDETAVPIVVGMIESTGGCANPVLAATINATAIAFDVYVRNASSPLCVDVATLCAVAGFSCATSPCGIANMTLVAGLPYSLPDVSLITKFATTARTAADMSIAQCVTGCSSNATKAAAAAVMTFVDGHAAAMEQLTGRVFPQTFGCRYVRDTLTNVIEPALCLLPDGLSARTTRLANLFGGLIGVATLALIFYVRGVKRFAQHLPEEAACPCACHDTMTDYGDRRPVCTCACSLPFGQVEMTHVPPPQQQQQQQQQQTRMADDIEPLPVQGIVVGSVILAVDEPQGRSEFAEEHYTPAVGGNAACVDFVAANPSKDDAAQ